MNLKKNFDEFYFGLMVDVFDKIATEKTYHERAEKIVKLIKKYNNKSKKILELACGTGNFTKQLASAGFEIEASDISKDEIEKAKTKKIKALFKLEDMSKIKYSEKYDVVCCFWESFRYLKTYKKAQDTLKRICKSLKSGGLFFVDFTDFPPHNKPFKLPTYTVDLGNGLQVLKDTYVFTKGNLDTRWDEMRYILNNKDVTGKNIIWKDKKVFLKSKLSRAPLLRISQNKMEEMLNKTGFNVLEVQSGFSGCPESMLFVSKK